MRFVVQVRRQPPLPDSLVELVFLPSQDRGENGHDGKWSRHSAARMLACHARNTGSIPVGTAI